MAGKVKTLTLAEGVTVTPSVVETSDVINGGQNGAVVVGTNDSNTLTLETNNTSAVIISATQKVGIGKTPASNRKLDIQSDGTGTDNIVVFANSTPTTQFYLQDNGTAVFSGNVGFGVAPSVSKVAIKGNIALQGTSSGSMAEILALASDSSESYIRAGSGGNFKVQTTGGGANIATFNSTGLGVGISPSYRSHIYASDGDGAGAYVAYIHNNSSTGNGIWVRAGSTSSHYIQQWNTYNNTAIARIKADGGMDATITAWGSSATQDVGFSVTTGLGSFNKFTSSRKYKENEKPLSIDTSLIYKLEEKEFDRIESGVHEFGLIAEDVADVLPMLTVFQSEHEKDEDGNSTEKVNIILDENGKPIPESVDYKLLSVLQNVELKKHEKKIDILEKKIKALEKKLA